MNPFPYSLANKRYHTLDYFYKNKYKTKVYKLTITAPFTCPNRDGSISVEGCHFCAYAIDNNLDLLKQKQQLKAHFLAKNPNAKFLLYFQSGSTTHPDVYKVLEYIALLDDEDILGYIIATRPDCLDKTKINLLKTVKKDLYIELGLQTIHDSTAKYFNRGYPFATFLNTLQLLKNSEVFVCVHLINGLPNESKKMMLETVKVLADLPIDMLKFHNLSIYKNSVWGRNFNYRQLTKSEYLDILVDQLELLPDHIVIARVCEDGNIDALAQTSISSNKLDILNGLDKLMASKNTYQGKYFLTKK